MSPRLRRAITGLLLASALAAGCAGAGDDRDVIVVFAASSLTDAFTEIEQRYEAEHPDVDVRVSTAGSAALRAQILDGAEVDVFVPADTETITQLTDGGVEVSGARVIARNRLVLVTPAGNPAGVESVADLGDPGNFIGLCVSAVPCGRIADIALDELGIEPAVDSREPNVRALRAKVAEGELDAALVYVTDAAALGTEVVVVGDPLGDPVDVPLVIVERGPAAAGDAASFAGFVASDPGRVVLADAGFELP